MAVWRNPEKWYFDEYSWLRAQTADRVAVFGLAFTKYFLNVSLTARFACSKAEFTMSSRE